MTNNSPSIRDLALAILNKRDTTWDSSGTGSKSVSQSTRPAGTVNSESAQRFNPTVPLSHTIGTGTPGQSPKAGTVVGTVAGQSCLQCGEPFGLAAREVTVRSTSDGQLALVHQDCLEAWLHWRPST